MEGMITNLLALEKNLTLARMDSHLSTNPCMFFVSIASCPGWISQVFLPRQ